MSKRIDDIINDIKEQYLLNQNYINSISNTEKIEFMIWVIC